MYEFTQVLVTGSYLKIEPASVVALPAVMPYNLPSVASKSSPLGLSPNVHFTT